MNRFLVLPWVPNRFGYRGNLVVEVGLWPIRIRTRKIWSRRSPPAPGSPADVARGLTEVGR